MLALYPKVLVKLDLIKLEFGDFFCGVNENPEENHWSKARTNNKLNPYLAPGRNRAWATLVGCECSDHCASLLGPAGISEFWFSGTLNEHRGRGGKHSLFPAGPDINCFVTPPNSKTGKHN